MLGARATFMFVILRLLARVCPPLCSRAFSAPNQPHQQRFRGGADKVRGRDRSVPHPRLHGCRINSARQPQARGRVSRSWMRRPSAMVVQARVRLKALACSWWPDSVTNNRASASRSAAIARTSGRTRSAIGTRRVLPDLVLLISTPSGSARCTTKIGSGTSTKSRTRMARSSDQRSPVQASISRRSASRWSRAVART
jgi:hypothetical protein